MARTRVRWGRVATLASVLAGTLGLAGRAVGGAGGELARGDRYVVREGDTLWGIARGLVGPQGDPRPVIEGMRRTNGLGVGSLLPGQTLVLPGPEE